MFLNTITRNQKKNCSLKEGERQNIIKLLREIADDFEESSMLNTYKLNKLNKRIEEYNTYRNSEREATTIYNIISTLEG